MKFNSRKGKVMAVEKRGELGGEDGRDRKIQVGVWIDRNLHGNVQLEKMAEEW